MRALLVALLTVVALSGCVQEEPDLEEWTPPPVKPVYAQVNSWPELQDAEIRPGAQIVSDSGACTSNFLFRSADNSTLYLGIAAHCFGSPSDPLPVGTQLMVGGIANAGKVAWNLWERDSSATADFGLVELSNNPSVRGKVHPAVMYYGGPTALADSGATLPGDYVITYGHSIQRPSGDPENPREGIVISHEDGGDITVWTDHPGIRGDSGSGLMTSDGQALGVLSRKIDHGALESLPNDERDRPTINMYVELDALLIEAQRDLGDIELVTWGLLKGATIPL